MKTTKYVLCALLLVSLAVPAVSADKMKTRIQISDTVNLNGTDLPAGQYTIAWTGTGSSTDVTFLKGNKVIATATAQVMEGRSGYAAPALNLTANRSLAGISLPKQTLSFDNASAASGK
jgi:hypothetical protein